MIFVPILSVFAVLVSIECLLSASSLSVLFHAFGSFALGLSVLFLLSGILANRTRLSTLFLTTGIMAATGIVTIISYTGLNPSGEMLGSFILYGIGTIVLLGGTSVTLYTIRDKYTYKRFRSWFPLWIVSSAVIMGFTALFLTGIMGSIRLIEILPVLMICGILGLFLYFVILPFLLLISHNSVYRDRFNAVFRIEEEKV